MYIFKEIYNHNYFIVKNILTKVFFLFLSSFMTFVEISLHCEATLVNIVITCFYNAISVHGALLQMG